MLEKFRTEANRCNLCAACHLSCPVYDHLSWEYNCARGRSLIILALLRNQIRITDTVLNSIYSCTLCKRCEVDCPPGVKLTDMVEAARFDFVRMGKGPLDIYKQLAENLRTKGNVLGVDPSVQLSIFNEANISQKPSENLLFVGCMAAYMYKNIAQSTAMILKAMNYDFTYLGSEEICCGGPLYLQGLEDEFTGIAKANVEKIEKLGIKRIIAICPMCYSAFKQLYTGPTKLRNIQILHITELLSESIGKEDLVYKKKFPLKVVYQDPCHLGRYSGIYEAPREILRRIPGLNLLELSENRELAKCCGGPIKQAFREVAYEISLDILRDAKNLGAEAIVTACPTCYHALTASSWEYQLKVFGITEVVATAMGL
ncbi:(Fe-S)-binding protein [Candidatus Bathyarchaeota archaeon]|nr:(Fe-S)-binding protein [Candidatus Bathyarchaeota archaeon]